MKPFWHGFAKSAAPVSFKKHVIICYWTSDDAGTRMRDGVKQLSFKYPSVKVKVINLEKDPAKPSRHSVFSLPTVLLLKDGREVDRLVGSNKTLLEQLFRKAHV